MKDNFEAAGVIVKALNLDEDGEPRLRADWEIVAEQMDIDYLQTMLPRIRALSEEQTGKFVVPDPVYHGGTQSGLTSLDPSKGQGYGTWFQDGLHEAAHFAVSRSTHQDSDGNRAFYEGYAPSVYEARLNVQRYAVFRSEEDLYRLAVPEEGDSEDIAFNNWAFRNPHAAREVLVSQGYDGIYLMDRHTFAAIKPEAIEIVGEYEAIPIFNVRVRPKIEAKFPDHDLYGHVPK